MAKNKQPEFAPGPYRARMLVWSRQHERYFQPGEEIDLSNSSPEEIETLLKKGIVEEIMPGATEVQAQTQEPKE